MSKYDREFFYSQDGTDAFALNPDRALPGVQVCCGGVNVVERTYDGEMHKVYLGSSKEDLDKMIAMLREAKKHIAGTKKSAEKVYG